MKQLIKQSKGYLRRQIMSARGYGQELDCSKNSIGKAAGAWTMRSDLLDPDSIVYSVGVGRDISFDLALIEETGVTVHAFDPTPRSIEWIKQQSLPEGFKFYEYGVAAYDGMLPFFEPSKKTSSHYSPVKLDRKHKDSSKRVEAPVFCLKTIMNKLGHQRIDLLKLDIEGGEYEVLNNLISDRIEVDQLLVEFHHNCPNVSFSMTSDALDSLRRAGYKIFHVSERSYEISLLKS